MTFQLFSPLVEKAMRVAAQCHRNQVRKGSHVSYLTHPAGVALILAAAGFADESTLAAALLHDAVEDCDYTSAQLEADFTPDVARLVASLTERKFDEHGPKRPWEVRRREHLAVVAAAPPAARAIALADKLHNLGSMLHDLQQGAHLWERFNAPPAMVLWYHEAMIAAAEQDQFEFRALANACRELLSRLKAIAPQDQSSDHHP